MTDPRSRIDALLPPIDDSVREMSPSALGQYIRFEQCQRFLRLDLYRGELTQIRSDAFAELGVVREEFAPLAQQSGDVWEQAVLAAIELGGLAVHRANEQPIDRRKRLDSWINTLQPGDRHIIAQPLLSGVIDKWEFKDVKPDIVLLRAEPNGARFASVIDIKASRSVTFDHRIQVAIYARLIKQRFPDVTVDEAIIYRPPLEPEDEWPSERLEDRDTAQSLLGTGNEMLLSPTSDPWLIHALLDRTLFTPNALANQIAAQVFSTLPYHLSGKCDACPNNQFCIATARYADDLSLIPYLTERLKRQLQHSGIESIDDLLAASSNPDASANLLASPGLGAHLGEITKRAAAYRAWSNQEQIDPWLRETEFTSLPGISPHRNQNLIQLFLDLQTDPSTGRVASLGALLVCFRDGTVEHARVTELVRVAGHPFEGDEPEAEFIRAWIKDVLVELNANKATDEDGRPVAPLHCYLWDSAQRGTLAAIANRQHASVFGIDAVFRLLTQNASFESPTFSVIADEIEHQRALPMLCQSLQSVSRWLGYRWPDEIVSTFRARQFDSLQTETDGEFSHLVPARSRFRSEIPGEYFRVAWNQIPSSEDVDLARGWGLYDRATVPLLEHYVRCRLAALRHITGTLRTDRSASKSAFDLSVLNFLSLRPDSPLESVREFIALERHIDFDEWRRERSQSPDRRVLDGESLLARYKDDDQEIDVRVKVREARERYQRRQEIASADFDGMTAEAKKALRWSLTGVEIIVRVDQSDLPIDREHILRNSHLRPGDHVIIGPAFADILAGEREPRPTRALALLYQFRGVINRISPDGTMAITLRDSWGKPGGFSFSSRLKSPPRNGELLTIEPTPDSVTEQRQWDVAADIRNGTLHGGYQLLWPGRPAGGVDHVRASAQVRFAQGLEELVVLEPSARRFEQAKIEYIGSNGDVPVLLVQGPPGTGKSTTTGLAILARFQSALAAGSGLRVAVGCKTHAATDVLLEAIRDAQLFLQMIEARHPEFFATWFDSRVLDVPLYRFDGRATPAPGSGIRGFDSASVPAQVNEALAHTDVVVAGTTNGLGKFAGKAWREGEPCWDLVVLDEASQMSVPEFLVATCGLKPDGRLIVVGDPRQMPPIIRGNWEEGLTTTIDPHAVYRSLFDTIKNQAPHKDIAFEESFRIHRDVATYLRDEIYHQDRIDLRSHRDDVLIGSAADALADVVLHSPAAVILITHDEAGSQQRNQLERELVSRLVVACTALDEPPSVGVVVPHRAQRADLVDQLYQLTGRADIATSVDTVERFQGAERDLIIVSATESDPAYLRDTASFLLDPRRLTVALSRAEQKLIVIASQSVFEYLPSDEQMLRDSELWRNLRDRFCTNPLWNGEFDGHRIVITGSQSAPTEEQNGGEQV